MCLAYALFVAKHSRFDNLETYYDPSEKFFGPATHLGNDVANKTRRDPTDGEQAKGGRKRKHDEIEGEDAESPIHPPALQVHSARSPSVPFPARVFFAGDRAQCLLHSATDYNDAWAQSAHASRRLALWPDASGRTGAAVVYCNPQRANNWVDKVYLLRAPHTFRDNNVSEYFAIAKALELAIEEVSRNNDIDTIIIYTDSESGLHQIRRENLGAQAQLDPIGIKIDVALLVLGMGGVNVVCRWVPGHSGDAGNSRADRLAGIAGRTRWTDASIVGLLQGSGADVELIRGV